MLLSSRTVLDGGSDIIPQNTLGSLPLIYLPVHNIWIIHIGSRLSQRYVYVYRTFFKNDWNFDKINMPKSKPQIHHLDPYQKYLTIWAQFVLSKIKQPAIH